MSVLLIIILLELLLESDMYEVNELDYDLSSLDSLFILLFFTNIIIDVFLFWKLFEFLSSNGVSAMLRLSKNMLILSSKSWLKNWVLEEEEDVEEVTVNKLFIFDEWIVEGLQTLLKNLIKLFFFNFFLNYYNFCFACQLNRSKFFILLNFKYFKIKDQYFKKIL